MGYYSRISGAISIEPALAWAEYRRHAAFLSAPDNYASVVLRTHEEPREAEGGVMLIRWADGIVPATDESIKAYDAEDEVQAIVSAFRSGHTFSGYLEVSGEDQGDLSRLYVRGGRVVRVTPTVTWPVEATL